MVLNCTMQQIWRNLITFLLKMIYEIDNYFNMRYFLNFLSFRVKISDARWREGIFVYNLQPREKGKEFQLL